MTNSFEGRQMLRNRAKYWSLLFLVGIVFFVFSSPSTVQVEGTIYPTYILTQTIGAQGPETGNFSDASTICLDAQGNLYVADDDVAGTIEIFNRAGVFIGNISGFNDPWGVAAYGNRLYVSDRGVNNLSVFVNNVLTNSTSFTNPQGIAVDEHGNVYVADFDDDSVYILSPSFVLLDTLVGLEGAFGVDVGPDGRIFVAATNDANITVFSPDHSLLGYLGQSGTDPGEFQLTYEVEVNVDGYIFVSDLALDRVQVFSPSFQLVGIINGIDGAMGVETDGMGRLYISSFYDDNVTVWQTDDLGDHTGPTIANVVINPLNPYSNQNVMVSAEITDVSGIHNATLTYTYPGANASTVVLNSVGNQYSATLPGFPTNTTVSFYIWTQDNSLNHYTTNSNVFRFNVNYPSVPITPYTPLFNIDPNLISLGAIGMGIIALIMVFVTGKKN